MVSRIAAGFAARLLHRDPLRGRRSSSSGSADVNKTSWGTTLYWAQNNSTVLQGEWWHFFFPGPRARADGRSRSCSSTTGIDELVEPASAAEASSGGASCVAARGRRQRSHVRPRDVLAAESCPAPPRERRCSSCGSSSSTTASGRGASRPSTGSTSTIRAGRDRRPRRRVRLRQEHDRERDPADPAPAGADHRRRDPLPRARTSSA